MKDYTIAQLCDLYRTDVKECATLTSYYYSQSLIMEEHTIKKAFDFIFTKLCDDELQDFVLTTGQQLKMMDYVVCNPLYQSNARDKWDILVNADFHIFGKRIPSIKNALSTYDPSDTHLRPHVYSIQNSETMERNTEFRKSGYDESDLTPYLCGNFEEGWGHEEMAQIIHNIRKFYKSDFYLNVFTPELQAQKLEWLIPAKKEPNKKSKI